MDPSKFHAILILLEGYTVFDFIHTLLSRPSQTRCPAVQSFSQQITAVLELIFSHPSTQSEADEFANQRCSAALAKEVAQLANKESGWHFSARNTSAAQLHAFSMEEMAKKLEFGAPLLWKLLGDLLVRENTRSSHPSSVPGTRSGLTSEDPEEEEYWALEEERLEMGVDSPDEPGDSDETKRTKRQRRAAERPHALHRIVREKNLLSINAEQIL